MATKQMVMRSTRPAQEPYVPPAMRSTSTELVTAVYGAVNADQLTARGYLTPSATGYSHEAREVAQRALEISEHLSTTLSWRALQVAGWVDDDGGIPTDIHMDVPSDVIGTWQLQVVSVVEPDHGMTLSDEEIARLFSSSDDGEF